MKALTLKFTEQADEDIFEASLNYADISNDVFNSFYSELAAAQSHIANFPSSGLSRYAHELKLANLRYWPLSRFPYALFYLEQDTHCRIIRLTHLSRDIPASLREVLPTLQ
jgi:toxin ParE1/3/4